MTKLNPAHPDPPTPLTRPQVVGISRNSLCDLMRRGEPTSIRIGQRVLVPKWAIEKLIGGPVEPEGAASATVANPAPVERQVEAQPAVALRGPLSVERWLPSDGRGTRDSDPHPKHHVMPARGALQLTAFGSGCTHAGN